MGEDPLKYKHWGRCLQKNALGRQRKQKKMKAFCAQLHTKKMYCCWSSADRVLLSVTFFSLTNYAFEAWRQFLHKGKGVPSNALWKFPTAMIGCRFLLTQFQTITKAHSNQMPYFQYSQKKLKIVLLLIINVCTKFVPSVNKDPYLKREI